MINYTKFKDPIFKKIYDTISIITYPPKIHDELNKIHRVLGYEGVTNTKVHKIGYKCFDTDAILCVFCDWKFDDKQRITKNDLWVYRILKSDNDIDVYNTGYIISDEIKLSDSYMSSQMKKMIDKYKYGQHNNEIIEDIFDSNIMDIVKEY